MGKSFHSYACTGGGLQSLFISTHKCGVLTASACMNRRINTQILCGMANYAKKINSSVTDTLLIAYLIQ